MLGSKQVGSGRGRAPSCRMGWAICSREGGKVLCVLMQLVYGGYLLFQALLLTAGPRILSRHLNIHPPSFRPLSPLQLVC